MRYTRYAFLIILLFMVILITGFYPKKYAYIETMDTIKNSYVKPTDYSYSDTQFHDTVDTISKQPDVFGIPAGTVFKENQYGEKYASLVGNDFTFYKKGSQDQYGSRLYVPSYEDSVYLSKYNQNLTTFW